MWAFVWLLQGLVASAAGVYLNTPCIRSLLRCAPFQLSLSDGKFSNNFIEDATTLNRQCRSIGPLLECMQEAVLQQCGLNISPAEKEFVKTRLFIAEICKDVDYTQKVYLRNAACINREKDWVIQACNPQDYVQLVNTSNLISLEGSCLFQKMLINCRQDAIHDKCGPDAADLYQRVKAVDMNLDFLCLESRDLRSPKFLLDIVINSYISLLLETLRPIIIMESLYLKDVVNPEDTPAPPTMVRVPPVKRAKKSAPYVQDVDEHKWRRFGDIPIETITEVSSKEESSMDSIDKEYFPVPSVVTPLEVVAVDTVNMETGTDSDELAPPVDERISDGLFDRIGLDLDGLLNTVVEEAGSDSAEHPNSAGSEFEQARFGSDVEGILGIPVPQFGHAVVDTTQDTNDVSGAIGADLGAILGANVNEPSDLDTTADSDAFQGMATQCSKYRETTVDDDAWKTTQHHDYQKASKDIKLLLDTTTRYLSKLETAIGLDFLQKTSLCSRDLKDTAAESGSLTEEPWAKLNAIEDQIFYTSLHSETRTAFGEESGSDSSESIISRLKRVKDFVSNPDNGKITFKDFSKDMMEIARSKDLAAQEYKRSKAASDLARVGYYYMKSTSPGMDLVFKEASDLISKLKADVLNKRTAQKHASNAKDLKSVTIEYAAAESLQRRSGERIDGIIKKELDRYVTSEPEESGSDIISRLKRVEDFVSNPNNGKITFEDYSRDALEILDSKELAAREYVRTKMGRDLAWVLYFMAKSINPEIETLFKEVSDVIKNLNLTGIYASFVEKHTSNAEDLERATTEYAAAESLEERSSERSEGSFEKELDGYVSSTVVSGVIDRLGEMFAPKEIERRSVSIPHNFIKSMSPKEVEELIHKNLPGGEFVKELVKSWDQTVDAESERQKSSVGDVKTSEKSVTDLKTIKSIAELGVKLNYVLIGESYVPLEVGYVDGNEEKKSKRNLKLPRRKFNFFTSTPTEPSTEIPDDARFSTTEYLPETSTEEPESFAMPDEGTLSSDFSCPEVTGNQTPRISHLVDPEERSRMEDCFGVLREETRIESPEDDENPSEETDQEFRRSGDIEELPDESVDPRDLDMETAVALKFYGEVLTELASLLPPGTPGSKTLAKRASIMEDLFGNYLKTKMDPSEIFTRMDEFRSGRRFQKRSLSVSAECPDQLKPVDGECKKTKTDDGVRFDIGYSPESYIRLEMSYPATNEKEDAYDVPVAQYIRMGETRLPLEIHFTHKNENYVHYAQLNIPRRSVDLKDIIALVEV